MNPSEKSDNATIEAAKLAFGHAWRWVYAQSNKAHIISTTLVPLFGIRWVKNVVADFDNRPKNRRRNKLLERVRNSPLTRVDYDSLSDHFKMGPFASVDFLPVWEEWRTAAGRYRLDRRR